MTTKEKLLELFESNKGAYFSGEELAKRLSVSRAAVWKAVKALRSEGYEIDAVTNKGYSLSVETDILSMQGIRKYIAPENSDMEMVLLPVTGSTNADVREKANTGAPEGYTVIACQQTAGKGRIGRKFYSPSDTGVYISILLRPENCPPGQAVKITTIAAVAACEAIEAVSEEEAQIKWVNDIFIRGKKVSGILTEASFDLESGTLGYAVLGIGINVYAPKEGFPEELEEVAGAVFQTHHKDVKNRLTAEFINRFMTYYSALSGHTAADRAKNGGEGAEQKTIQTDAAVFDYVEKYRRRSLVIGREVRVLLPDGERKALVTGIDDECRLLVKYEDGKEDRLASGEISIRL